MSIEIVVARYSLKYICNYYNSLEKSRASTRFQFFLEIPFTFALSPSILFKQVFYISFGARNFYKVAKLDK